MKTLGYCIMLAAIATIWSVCGYTYASGSMEPIYIDKPYAVETVVERKWDETMRLGIGADGSLTELAADADQSLYVYIVTVNYMTGDCMADNTVWIPFGTDTYAGVSLRIPCSEYQVLVSKVGEPDSSKMPKPLEDGEDEF